MEDAHNSPAKLTFKSVPHAFNLTTLWLAVLVVNSIAVGAYVLSEWLFIATRPSFLDATGWGERLVVFFVSFGFLLSLTSIFASLIYRLAATAKILRIQNQILSIFPAFVLASLCLLLFDNFTYTAWKFGVSTSVGWLRLAYLLGFLLVFIFWICEIPKLLLWLEKLIARLSIKTRKLALIASLTGLLVMVLPFLRMPDGPNANMASLRPYDNVILISADGLNATHMSVYGYERQTTPFLDSISNDLFLSRNHFPNSGNTSGAITSLLTSKYPSQTRVLYPPDLLRGEDSHQHLPGILRDHGYYTAQLSIDHYADAKALNFMDGFDEINGERMRAGFSPWKSVNQRFPENARFLLQEIEERLLERLKHIFFIEPMSNSFVQITMRSQDFKDQEKITNALRLLEEKEEAVFIHLHWMGTHGSKFYPLHTTFSAGVDRSAVQPWNKDLYDDSILDFDAGIEDLISGLRRIGEEEETLVLITSDHGQGFLTSVRIPLILWKQPSFSLSHPAVNTQALDVAPTILDYLSIDQPEWMRGGSLIDPDYRTQPVIGIGTRSTRAQGDDGWALDEKRIKPPFYQFDYVTLLDCNRNYNLNLDELIWKRFSIEGYATMCNPESWLSPEQIRDEVIGHLRENGFEFDPDLIPLPNQN